MLKTRIVTALILAPVVIAAIYLLPAWAFALFVGAAAGLAIYEWAGLAHLQSTAARLGFVAVFGLAAGVAWFVPSAWWLLVLLACGAWLLACVIVLFHPRANVLISHPAAVAVFGLVIGLGAWAALISIRQIPHGAHWVMWVLLICWAADIGAYFSGKAFGRRKLAPSVSPGKTWEGAVGGALLAVLVCGGLLAYAGFLEPVWLVLIVALVAVSIVGDLFESVLKRHSQVKDSGSLLPGHGGMLDRIDSILAAAPVFALLCGLFPAMVGQA